MSRPDEPSDRKHVDASRTLPLEEGARLREELRTALRSDRRPVVVVISGNEMGQRRRIDRGLVIGRDPRADLVLTDAGVSWQHARIEDRGGEWVVVDLGSTNGCVVNGKKLAETVLAGNDKIVLGRTVLRFEVQDALEQAYDEQLQRMLNFDDLSGLFVRRAFDSEVGLLFETARTQSEPLALLVMDLDGLKSINDAHGHLFGAYVISEAGQLIGRVLGTRGIGCRFGGDEFSAALFGLDLDEGAQVGEEIRVAIAEHRFEREGTVLRVGISIGVAAYPGDGDDAEGLFKRADEALYRAKQGGRNRVSR